MLAEARGLKPVSHQNRRACRCEHADSRCHVFGFTPAHTASRHGDFGVKTPVDYMFSFLQAKTLLVRHRVLRVETLEISLVSGMKMP